MTNERKASDVLLDLENKIDQLTKLIYAQDLNIKVLSNKLNVLMDQLKNEPKTQAPMAPMATAENVKVPDVILQNRNQVIIPNNNLPMVDKPQGIRRGSRAADVPVVKISPPTQKISIHDPAPPDMSRFKNLMQQQNFEQEPEPEEQPEFKPFENINDNTNRVAVSQRVIDVHGKSIFLADVEILDQSNVSIFKNRTNSVGKWQASLAPGNYKIIISKREPITKQVLEQSQLITVDGKAPQIVLDKIIIKQ